MKVAVLRSPGSNCDQDALWSLRDHVGVQAEYVWHESTSLQGFDAVFLPGGFTYGDYLRCGAIASRSPIMDEVQRFAKEGRPVIGVCNGFQVLCEARILPGALLLNKFEKFLCKTVILKAVNTNSPWTRGVDRLLHIPIAHNEGRFVCDADTLKQIQDEDRIAFRYVDDCGRTTEDANPNGATDNIAGVLNPLGNVLGIMPHPERACDEFLGSKDGLVILQALNLVFAR
ncbi:MAG TPA: phosphoribosylformylglycinamidine synthase subunit PurQ [Fimbriimonadaceae bacterium]|nr:phosphoribosylformylglycinamidine synthase subunit PurQ [Fimbriimonadaceae bacterium]